jgi:hypothetical protein
MRPPGGVGLWAGFLDHLPAEEAVAFARDIEAAGVGAIRLQDYSGVDPSVGAALFLSGRSRLSVAAQRRGHLRGVTLERWSPRPRRWRRRSPAGSSPGLPLAGACALNHARTAVRKASGSAWRSAPAASMPFALTSRLRARGCAWDAEVRQVKCVPIGMVEDRLAERRRTREHRDAILVDPL